MLPFRIRLLTALTGAVMLTPASLAAPVPPGETVAEHGMVATTHPLAVRIGVEILKQGGNAIDAAIATNAAMGLMEPMSCGVGGDLYAIVWDAKSQKLYGLNASGRSPYRATREFFAAKGLKEIPTSGPLSWSVPGCVDGWDQLARRFGTMPLSRLLEPSIRYADEGAQVPPTIGGFWRAAERKLSRYPDSAKTYLPDGKAPRVGELFKNPRLAQTYRQIAAGGRDAFYRGQIAKDIVAFSDANGGLFSLRDFEEHTSSWVEPVSTTYRGYDVWEIPPPSQGITVLQMLNILEGYDLKAMGPASADWWHVLIEAKKLAYADRAKYYTDPEFAKVPTAELISKPYAAKQRELIDMQGAAEDVQPGDVKVGQSDTIYLCVVDKDRNCVSLIQSNYSGFGSGLVPGELGFILQNRGTLFALDPEHVNRLEPHKRPFHTIIPAMVMKEGKPYFVFGVMGGDMQPQGQVQVLVNLLDFGMEVYAAGAAPRVEHLYSATPTGRLAHGSGTVEAEPGVPEAAVLELERRGHHVVRVRKNGGGYEGILIDGNRLRGASEVRRDGVAEGY
jgi:gamma-glutamyltranspeptidase/glutathione hydrolase